jgi:protein PhnA
MKTIQKSTFAAIRNGIMKQDELLANRSGDKCELCKATENLKVYEVPPATGNMDDAILVCPKCLAQIEKKEELDAPYWQCLTTSMWCEVPAVQVMAWRMLNRLRNESWAAENLDMLYLDDERLAMRMMQQLTCTKIALVLYCKAATT